MALDDADIQWPMELSFVRQCLQKKFRLTCLPMTGGGESRKPKFTCGARRCGQTFDTREALNQHETTHKAPVMAGMEAKHKYHCHHCRKEFVEHGALRRHLQVSNRGNACHQLFPRPVSVFIKPLSCCSNASDPPLSMRYGKIYMLFIVLNSRG